MVIISAYLAKENPNKVNTYIVFFAPNYAGDGIGSAELHMHQWFFEDYKVPIFSTYSEARKHAHIESFGLEHYYFCFPSDPENPKRKRAILPE